MSYLRDLLVLAAVAAIFGSLSGCAAPTVGKPGSEEELSAAKGDHFFDLCDLYGWYGDGECDTFCDHPDPDCDQPHVEPCWSDSDCPTINCITAPCPRYICNDSGQCEITDDEPSRCAPGEQECPACSPDDVICVDVGSSCPRLACPPPPDDQCHSDADCPQPYCLPGGPCPYFECVDGQCVEDSGCPAGERECPGCQAGDFFCVSDELSCPLLGCPPPDDSVCEPGEQECPGCGEGQILCIDEHVACPLLACPPPPDDEPASCGGIAGLLCGEDEYCHFPDGTCGWADRLGECLPRYDVCTADWNPVCGCDGTTYSNACSAGSRGVSIRHHGAC